MKQYLFNLVTFLTILDFMSDIVSISSAYSNSYTYKYG
jgi:hypothetical protein